MYPKKAKFVTVMFSVMFFSLMGVTVAEAPWSLPWILGAFAIPGAWKFIRTLYIWLLDRGPEPEGKVKK